MCERCVDVDTIEAAGQADPGVQTGIGRAVVRRMSALVAQSPLDFYGGHAVCPICNGDAVAVCFRMAGRRDERCPHRRHETELVFSLISCSVLRLMSSIVGGRRGDRVGALADGPALAL